MSENEIEVKKEGKRHIGLCPFHKEQTPSFSVNFDNGTYFCFGCYASGNIGELSAIHNCKVSIAKQ